MNIKLKALLFVICLTVPVQAAWSISGAAEGDTELNAPFSLKVGDIVVADEGAGSVLLLRGEDEPLTLATGLEAPRGVAIDSDGSVVVIESAPGRAVRLSPDGTSTVVIDRLSDPDDVAIAGDGIVIAETGEDRVIHVADDGTVRELLVDVDEPTGVDIALDGTVAVSLHGTGDEDGSVVLTGSAGGDAAPIGSPYQSAAHLDLDPTNIPFLADDKGRLVEVNAGAGKPGRIAAETEGLAGATGVAVDVNVAGSARPYTVLVAETDALVRIDADTGFGELLIPLVDGAGVDVFSERPTDAGPPPTFPPTESTTSSTSTSLPFGSAGDGSLGRDNDCDWPRARIEAERFAQRAQRDIERALDDALRELERMVREVEDAAKNAEPQTPDESMQKQLDDLIKLLTLPKLDLPTPELEAETNKFIAELEKAIEATRALGIAGLDEPTGATGNDEERGHSLDPLDDAAKAYFKAQIAAIDEVLDGLDEAVAKAKDPAIVEIAITKEFKRIEGWFQMVEGSINASLRDERCSIGTALAASIDSAGSGGGGEVPWPLVAGVLCAGLVAAAGIGIWTMRSGGSRR